MIQGSPARLPPERAAAASWAGLGLAHHTCPALLTAAGLLLPEDLTAAASAPLGSQACVLIGR
jgi:hypothetical protein